MGRKRSVRQMGGGVCAEGTFQIEGTSYLVQGHGDLVDHIKFGVCSLIW